MTALGFRDVLFTTPPLDACSWRFKNRLRGEFLQTYNLLDTTMSRVIAHARSRG